MTTPDTLLDLRALLGPFDPDGEDAADLFFALRRLIGPSSRARWVLAIPAALAYVIGCQVTEPLSTPLYHGSRWSRWAALRDGFWLVPAAWRGGAWG